MLLAGHRQWEPYQLALSLAKEIYRVTTLFPDTERAVLVYTLRRLAVTLSQNIAKAAVKKGKKRRRVLQTCVDDCIAFDTQLELALAVQVLPAEAATEATKHLHELFKKLMELLQPQ